MVGQERKHKPGTMANARAKTAGRPFTPTTLTAER